MFSGPSRRTGFCIVAGWSLLRRVVDVDSRPQVARRPLVKTMPSEIHVSPEQHGRPSLRFTAGTMYPTQPGSVGEEPSRRKVASRFEPAGCALSRPLVPRGCCAEAAAA